MIKSFKPTKQDKIERNLFELDFMTNICDQLNLIFLINKISFEKSLSEEGELPGLRLICYNNEEERSHKFSILEKEAKAKGIKYYITYIDLELVRSKIDSLMLMPSIIIRMTKSRINSVMKEFKEEINSLQKNNRELIPDAQLGRKFKGKPLTPENEKVYKEILALQKELFDKHGPGQISGLTNSVREYNKRKKCFWDDLKIKSVSETIRVLKDKGRI